MKDSGPNAGWLVGPSIAQELDMALGLTGMGTSGFTRLTGRGQAFVDAVDPEWLSQWQAMLGAPREWLAVMGPAAQLAGVAAEADYSRATLAIRELTAAAALERAAAYLRPYGLAPDAALAPADALIDLMTHASPAITDALGMQSVSREAAMRTAAYEAGRMVRILRGGDLHARFWHWLDRAYWEWYRPWREEQGPLMAGQEERALAQLGARQGAEPPELSWLPPQNPLRVYPELARAIQDGRLQVLFWTQPFGLFDAWMLSPGMITVTFAEPSHGFDEFRSRATDLAERAKALSDPTRLAILRLIRHFSKDNTQMADYLGIARPTVSIHAKVLREAGLIETHPEGRAVRHQVDAAGVRRLFRELEEFLDLPDDEPATGKSSGLGSGPGSGSGSGSGADSGEGQLDR